jgi:hypothetical protein
MPRGRNCLTQFRSSDFVVHLFSTPLSNEVSIRFNSVCSVGMNKSIFSVQAILYDLPTIRITVTVHLMISLMEGNPVDYVH